MTSKNVHLKIGELNTNIGQVKNLELSVGRIINDSWEEPMGTICTIRMQAGLSQTQLSRNGPQISKS